MKDEQKRVRTYSLSEPAIKKLSQMEYELSAEGWKGVSLSRIVEMLVMNESALRVVRDTLKKL